METDIMPRETEVSITLYSQPGCVQCDAIKRKFKLEGLVEGDDFTVVDISRPENAGDYEAIKALDYMRVPVTFVNEHHFGGYDTTEVADAIARKKRTKMHLVDDLAVA